MSVDIRRPPFSARRTTRRGGLALYLRLRGGSLRDVRATIKDRRGRTVLAGARASLPASGRVPLTRRARLRPGPVRVAVSGLDRSGQRVRATRSSRLVR